MSTKRINRVALIGAASAALVAGCANLAPHGATQEVSIRFAADINGKPFECGKSYPGVGTTASTITPSDLRFYVSDVHLIDAQGRAVPVALKQDGVWQLENVALLDFENGTGPCRNGTTAMNDRIVGQVPAGDWRGVRFTLGVPFARNHGDPTTAPAPLNLTAMFWNWQGGYKFLKFDTATSGISPEKPAAPSAQGPVTRYAVHLGSTLCSSPARTQAPAAPCGLPNSVTVQFDRFDPARQVVVADLGRLLAQANVDVNAAGTVPGCMSFPKDGDCPPIMAAFGLPYDGTPPPSPQRLFSLR